MSKIMNEVEIFLTKEGKYTIDKDDNLFDKGFLDSMGVLEVISIIEEVGDLEFDPEFFIIENFKTLNSIEELILKEIND